MQADSDGNSCYHLYHLPLGDGKLNQARARISGLIFLFPFPEEVIGAKLSPGICVSDKLMSFVSEISPGIVWEVISCPLKMSTINHGRL